MTKDDTTALKACVKRTIVIIKTTHYNLFHEPSFCLPATHKQQEAHHPKHPTTTPAKQCRTSLPAITLPAHPYTSTKEVHTPSPSPPTRKIRPIGSPKTSSTFYGASKSLVISLSYPKIISFWPNLLLLTRAIATVRSRNISPIERPGIFPRFKQY